MTLPRPGHADLAGVLKYGLADVRDALERASARHTAVVVAAGAVAKALLQEIGIEVEGAVLGDDLEAARRRGAQGARHGRRPSSRCVPRACRPGLGSYASRETRLDARLAAALMGIQAVKGVEIGDGFALAGLRGSEAHDEIHRDERGLYRETNRAGGIEAGISNGEQIVVRAAMKPLPTLMKPLQSVDLDDRRAGRGARRAQRHRRDRGARRRRRGGGRVRARAGGPGEVRRRRARRLRRRVQRVPRADRLATALDRHLALVGFMGAGKSTLGLAARRTASDASSSTSTASSRASSHETIPEIFARRGEVEFRVLEQATAVDRLARGKPAVSSRSAAAR